MAAPSGRVAPPLLPPQQDPPAVAEDEEDLGDIDDSFRHPGATVYPPSAPPLGLSAQDERAWLCRQVRTAPWATTAQSIMPFAAEHELKVRPASASRPLSAAGLPSASRSDWLDGSTSALASLTHGLHLSGANAAPRRSERFGPAGRAGLEKRGALAEYGREPSPFGLIDGTGGVSPPRRPASAAAAAATRKPPPRAASVAPYATLTPEQKQEFEEHERRSRPASAAPPLPENPYERLTAGTALALRTAEPEPAPPAAGSRFAGAIELEGPMCARFSWLTADVRPASRRGGGASRPATTALSQITFG